MKLIGLGGQLRSGKDALADWLVENKNYVKMGMSDALNEALLALNPWILTDFPVRVGFKRTTTWEPIRYRDLHDAVGYVEAKKHSEVRRLLQMLGTEVGRKMIHEDVWVDIAEKKIREHWDAGNNVVITAMRFPNELDMLARLGGTSAWVERDEALRLSETSESSGSGADTKKAGNSATEAHTASQSTLLAHDSENSVNSDMFTYHIFNNGTLEELYEEADGLDKYASSHTTPGQPLLQDFPTTVGAEILAWPKYDH